MALADRPFVPEEWVLRIDAVLGALPRCRQESAWTGTRWRVGSATVAHVFGGEDQLFRITFRGEPDEVAAFEHMGGPYFRSGWGGNAIGMVLDDAHGLGRPRRAAHRLLLPPGAGHPGRAGAPALALTPSQRSGTNR